MIRTPDNPNKPRGFTRRCKRCQSKFYANEARIYFCDRCQETRHLVDAAAPFKAMAHVLDCYARLERACVTAAHYAPKYRGHQRDLLKAILSNKSKSCASTVVRDLIDLAQIVPFDRIDKPELPFVIPDEDQD